MSQDLENTALENELRKLLTRLDAGEDPGPLRAKLQKLCNKYVEEVLPYEWNELELANMAVRLREGARIFVTCTWANCADAVVEILHFGPSSALYIDDRGEEGVVAIHQLNPATVREKPPESKTSSGIMH